MNALSFFSFGLISNRHIPNLITFIVVLKISSFDNQLSFEEKIVLDELTAKPSHIDELIKKTGLPVGKIADILIKLQLKGMVKELPGKFFIKEV